MSNDKIFVVSLHKCMTRSTDVLLSMLGYSTAHFPKFFGGRNLMEAIRGVEAQPEVVIDRLMPVLEARDAIGDVPIPGLYRGLAQRWPESRFILVARDPREWASSVHRHLRKRKLSPFNRVQYLPYIPDCAAGVRNVTTERLAEMHERHRRDVERYFAEELGQPERLCVVDAREDRVGERICTFLGFPPRPLPRISGRSEEEELAGSRDWVQARPDKQEAHYLLAKNLLQAGDAAAARQSLRRAIELEPDQPKPYALLSDVLAAEGKAREASAMARAAVDNGLVRRKLCYRGAAGAAREGRPLAGARYWMRGVLA